MKKQDKTNYNKLLEEVRRDKVATLICMPFTADTDDFVSYSTIGKDFIDGTEAEEFYNQGIRMDLYQFLEEASLTPEQHSQIFHTRGCSSPLLYSLFKRGGVQRLEQYIGVPLIIVEGSERYTPTQEIRELPREQIEF
jgi:hypothetical protein